MPPNRTFGTAREAGARHLEQLEQLPPDVGGRIKELRDYDFMDPEARAAIRRADADAAAAGHAELLPGPAAEPAVDDARGDAADPRDGAATSTICSRSSAAARTPRTISRSSCRSGASSSPRASTTSTSSPSTCSSRWPRWSRSCNSMTPEMRQQLEDMMDALFQDSRLPVGAGAACRQPRPHRSRCGGQAGELPFWRRRAGELQEAMQLMGDMNSMDELERELMQAVRNRTTSSQRRLGRDRPAARRRRSAA